MANGHPRKRLRHGRSRIRSLRAPRGVLRPERVVTLPPGKIAAFTGHKVASNQWVGAGRMAAPAATAAAPAAPPPVVVNLHPSARMHMRPFRVPPSTPFARRVQGLPGPDIIVMQEPRSYLQVVKERLSSARKKEKKKKVKWQEPTKPIKVSNVVSLPLCLSGAGCYTVRKKPTAGKQAKQPAPVRPTSAPVSTKVSIKVSRPNPLMGKPCPPPSPIDVPPSRVARKRNSRLSSATWVASCAGLLLLCAALLNLLSQRDKASL